MKLLSLYYTHKPGGFCKRLYRLLNALNNKGHEVHYLALDKPPDSFPEDVYWKKIPFPLSIRKGLIFWSLFIIWCPVYILYYSSRFRPQRYFVFGAFYSTLIWLSNIFIPAPTILFLRSLVYKIHLIQHKSAFIKILSNMFDYIGMKRATKIVCMTESMAKDVSIFLRDKNFKGVILPNDLPKIDINSSIPEKIIGQLSLKDRFTILTSGVLDDRKNIEFIIDVFRLIKAEEPSLKWTLLISGEGSSKSKLHQLVTEQKLEHIHFLGWCNNMTSLYNQVQLVLHPSLHEGMPNSVLEPLSLGIPVLCSDIPEHRELLMNLSLVFDLNNKSLLAKRLISIIKHPEDNLKWLREDIAEPMERLRFDWDDLAVKAVINTSASKG